MKLLIINLKVLFLYIIFSFKLFIVILNPFRAWLIKLSISESKKDFEVSFFFILSKALFINESIKLFLSLIKISSICFSVILLINISQETSFKSIFKLLFSFSSGISIQIFLIFKEFIVIWG